MTHIIYGMTPASEAKAGYADLRLRPSQVVRLVGLTHGQLDYWARTGLLVPSKGRAMRPGAQRLYSFDDVVRLRVLKRLLGAGMSLNKVREVSDILSEQLSSGLPITNMTILSDGLTIFAAQSAEEIVDLFRRGQGVFGIAVGPVAEELARAVADLSAADEGGDEADDLALDEDTWFVDQLTSRLRDRILEIEADWRAGGESLTSLGDPDEWVRRLVATVPDRSPWDERIGPFYRTTGVAERLGGISRQAVMDRIQRGSILGLMTSDGVWVYPAWQFLDDGSLRPGLRDVLAPFAARNVDGWEVAGWLESTFKELGGTSPRHFLLTTGGAGVLAAMARDAAAHLAA